MPKFTEAEIDASIRRLESLGVLGWWWCDRCNDFVLYRTEIARDLIDGRAKRGVAYGEAASRKKHVHPPQPDIEDEAVAVVHSPMERVPMQARDIVSLGRIAIASTPVTSVDELNATTLAAALAANRNGVCNDCPRERALSPYDARKRAQHGPCCRSHPNPYTREGRLLTERRASKEQSQP